jgi:peptidoglycan/xylan/chitin deacetylase (PgdA/CDA1 family)
MSKRLFVANVLEKTGANAAILALRKNKRVPWLPVVTFHRIAEPNHPFDDGVVDASPAEFDAHVRTIRRYFTPVGIPQVLGSLEGKPLPPNPILVTFDDGYRDNLEVALPILQRHDVKAVFFIATHYLTHRTTFWWDRINYIYKTSGRSTISNLSLDAALRKVKDTVGLDLDGFLDELAFSAGVLWTRDLDRQIAESLLMTWDEVRQLRDAGMDIESHTRTHRVLQTLSPAELRDELVESRRDLEHELGTTVSAISYPIGHRLGHRDDVRDALRAAGYKLGFTNATGTHRVNSDVDPYDVNRIGLDYGTPEALFRAILAAPPLFG